MVMLKAAWTTFQSRKLSQSSVRRTDAASRWRFCSISWRKFANRSQFGSRTQSPRMALSQQSSKVRSAFLMNLTQNCFLGRTIVYIKQRDLLADVTFPVEPKVISLADYDRMSEAAESPKAGYPVVCVTACDPKNPLFEEVRALCEDERIDNTMTEYRLVSGRISWFKSLF